MTFKAGQSGNPKGRQKGVPNKRTELAKMLDPHAEELVAKMIELALEGDVTALRLCMERLIPKANRESTGIEFQKNISKLKDDILRAALDGRVSIADAERLGNLVSVLSDKNIKPLRPYRSRKNISADYER
ncbi:MAG: hypothetical protein LEGION0403_FIIPPAGN_02325 [Legionella sp.]|uniref:DUF5681 domain-containing protein n=1 Tax=Legionella sp. TaxID=459 RepID=UPI003D13F0DD